MVGLHCAAMVTTGQTSPQATNHLSGHFCNRCKFHWSWAGSREGEGGGGGGGGGNKWGGRGGGGGNKCQFKPALELGRQ